MHRCAVVRNTRCEENRNAVRARTRRGARRRGTDDKTGRMRGGERGCDTCDGEVCRVCAAGHLFVRLTFSTIKQKGKRTGRKEGRNDVRGSPAEDHRRRRVFSRRISRRRMILSSRSRDSRARSATESPNFQFFARRRLRTVARGPSGVA